MLTLISKYIDDKGLAWALSTQRTEHARLRAIEGHIKAGPEALYQYLKAKEYKPYSIKTYFIRAGEFYQWLIEEGHAPALVRKNPYKEFIKKNALLFKHVYQKETLDVTYDEAIRRINRLSCREAKAKALDLIATGMRYTESTTETTSNIVVGKGNKRRRIYRPDGLTPATKLTDSYSVFYHKLKAVGLKPHTLRKLAATRFVSAGAKEADLMKLMGWNSIGTAASYLQANRDSALSQLVTEAFK